MAQPAAIKTEADVLVRVRQVTALDRFTHDPVSTKMITAGDADIIPFTGGLAKGRQVWQAVFPNVTLKLPSGSAGQADWYAGQRTFVVLMDGHTGQMLSLRTEFKGDRGQMRPGPTPASAEAQTRSQGEIYSAPTAAEAPKLSLVDALDAVNSRGFASPFVAKEINASYVKLSRLGSQPRPVWVITLRGLPAASVVGPPGSSNSDVPEWQRNHLRHVVDAATGEVLYATTSPQPV